MKSFQVARVNLSPYQHPDFMRLEKDLLELLPEVEYRTPQDLRPGKATILITNTHTDISSLPQEIMGHIKLIIHPNSGYDNFEKDYSLWKDIPLVVGHAVRAQAVAEHTLGCLFEGVLELPQHITWNKERKWERRLMKDLPVCLFGRGHIGKIVNNTLKALGMEVSIVDPFIPGCAKSWKEVDLSQMKVVISCMSLNSTSRKLFNADFFNSANDELLFINGARGGLVDETALKDFLLSHPKAFAFLDVFEKEPFDERWHHFPQIWKTSHLAGVHRELDRGILDFEYQVLNDYLALPENGFKTKYHQELLQNKWIQGELI